jgi:hypothetical protein
MGGLEQSELFSMLCVGNIESAEDFNMMKTDLHEDRRHLATETAILS